MSLDSRPHQPTGPSIDLGEETTDQVFLDELPARPARPRKDRGTLILIAGPMAGGLFTIDEGPLVFGRSGEASARIDDRGLSRSHARVFRDAEKYFIEDLGSTNGTFVNGQQVGPPRELREGDRVQMGANTLLRFHLHDAMEQDAARRLYESAVRDPLTKAYNRRYLDERLDAELAYAKRHGTPLSVLLLDVDHFKRFNDEHGHLAGDAVLRIVGATLDRILRAEDVIARYGGEEFCVVARGIDRRNAMIVAERLRRSIASIRVPWESHSLQVTVSCGVATYDDTHRYDSSKELLAASDEALYGAKEQGRNRCCEAA